MKKISRQILTLVILKNTLNSNSARHDMTKNSQQNKIIKKLSTQLHIKQTLTKKDLFIKFKQFANNAQKIIHSDDKIDVLIFETNDLLKLNDVCQTIYKKIEQYLQRFMLNLKNIAAKIQISRLNKQIKKNIKNNFKKKDLINFLSTFLFSSIILK